MGLSWHKLRVLFAKLFIDGLRTFAGHTYNYLANLRSSAQLLQVLQHAGAMGKDSMMGTSSHDCSKRKIVAFLAHVSTHLLTLLSPTSSTNLRGFMGLPTATPPGAATSASASPQGTRFTQTCFQKCGH